MRGLARPILFVGLLIGAGAAFASAGAEAAQRNCQTLLTCNYSKGGSYRGCLSSYSCRACRFVPSRCQIGNTTGRCQKLVCDWAGS